MALRPLILKNLILVKRNIFKTLLELFYPCIILIIMISFLSTKEKFIHIPEISFSNVSSIISLNDDNYSTALDFLSMGDVALITRNRILSAKFNDYLKISSLLENKLKVFNSSAELTDYLQSNQYKNSTMIIIAIKAIEDNKQINFEISLNDSNYSYTSIADNTNPFNIQSSILKITNQLYIFEIQKFLTRFLLYFHQSTIHTPFKIKLVPSKSPKLSIDPAMNSFLILILPFFFSVSYISILFKFVLWLVSEKEKKLKDMLFRQGITGFEYILSWLFTFIILVTVPLMLNTYLLKEYFLTKTNSLIIFFTLFLYNINILSMAFLFQNFCHDIRSSQTLLKIVYIGITFLGVPLGNESTPIFLRYIFTVFPQVALKYCFEILLQSEVMPNGLDSNLMNLNYKDFSFYMILIIFAFDFTIYSGVSYILQNKEHFDFSLWKRLKSKLMKKEDLHKKIDDLFQSESKCELDLISEGRFVSTIKEEVVNENLILQDINNENLKIQSISKRYDQLLAVNNVSLTLYKNQIFVLLGHNGAGKTTLINIINGMTNCDQGQILFQNQNLIHNKEFLYKNIGLCSQDNIFFDELTVEENLRIMQEIKGNVVDKMEIDDLLSSLELLEKKDCLSGTLSGGQKRKLSIALAMISNSKLILLDEPTSGMDVTAKRSLWSFLKSRKNNKIIILTTHSLDEADYLADRIGIVAEGKLICCGTSSFLKNHYSCGFNVNLLFNDDENLSNSNMTMNKFKLIKKLKIVEPKLSVKVISRESILINFPVISENCDKIFSKIQELQSEFNLLNYIVSTTSLEDVFLKVNNNEFSKNLFENELNSFQDENNQSSIFLNVPPQEMLKLNKSQSSILNEIKLNIIRHAISNYRNKKTLLMEMVASLMSFFVSLLCASVFFYSTKNINFYKLLNKTQIFYSFKDSIQEENINDLLNNFPHKSILVNPLSNMTNISDFDEILFNYNQYHNTKAAFYIESFSKDNIEINIIYHSISTDFGISLQNVILKNYLSKFCGIESNLIESIELLPNVNQSPENNPVFYFVAYFLFLILSSFINLSGYMINTPLKERINNIKHLQYLNGMNMSSYWISLLIVDLSKYIVFMILIYPFLIYFNHIFFMTMLPLLITFSIALTLFCYSFSYIFDAEENGQKFYLITSYMITFLYPVILSLVFHPTQIIDNFTFTLRDLFPQSSIIDIFKNIYIAFFFPNLIKSSLSKVCINAQYVFLIQIIIYSSLLYCLEKQFISRLIHEVSKRCFRKPLNTVIENKYINKEKERLSDNKLSLTMKLSKISKCYNNICEEKVLALNLSLEKNEKFGLLGYNGSGKSTTFKAITREILLDEGFIEIFNYNNSDDFEILRKNIGYCPQNYALFDNLTVNETFAFYDKIKSGVLKKDNNNDELLRDFGLIQYKNTLSKNLSGGNQRKLNFAIALMNKPCLLLLDEPSTGVDPESRRILWKQINDIKRTNRMFNLILSTHSLEEAEILCDKIGWMKKGNFICIGNPEKLKYEFSEGYIIQLKFKKINNLETNQIKFYQDNLKNPKEILVFLNDLTNINIIDFIRINNVEGFHYLYLLNEVVSKVKKHIISAMFMNQYENQFEICLKLDPLSQGKVFSSLLKLKNKNDSILEVNIKIQSLETIFNKLDNHN